MKFEHTRTMFGYNRFMFIVKNLGETTKLDGCMAEIGVHRGGMSYFLSSSRPDSLFFSCDSFEGLPEPTDRDNNSFRKGDFSDVSYDEVKEYLSINTNIKVIKGFFPNEHIHKEMMDKKYFFVHLDVDLYESTMLGLKFFYPRMVHGGIIVIDDYPYVNGVESAVDEFCNEVGTFPKSSSFGNCRIKRTNNILYL